MNSSLSRRQFLRRLGIAGGAVAGMPFLRELEAVENPARPLEVVIVGAGLAGLVSAYELQRRGHKMVILEADARHVGGRVRTLRFEDGLYGEAGAMRIPQGHDLTRHYVSEFKLPLRKFVQTNPEAFFYLRGRRERIKDLKKLNGLYDLTPAEREITAHQMWENAVAGRLKGLTPEERADLFSPSPKTQAVRRLDQMSLVQLCQAAGLSEEALELLMVSNGVETLIHSAATEFLREESSDVWNHSFDEIVGGTDRLPAAFAERLESKPRLGCRVVKLTHDKEKKRAAAIYLEGGVEKRAEGDFLLCTLPLPVLGRTPVEPPMSGVKQRAIRELTYDSSTKVLAICNRRFWESKEGIFGGGTFTDLPTGTTYYPADNAEAQDPKVSAGSGVMLASYTWGQQARRLGMLLERERADLVIAHLAAVHPELLEKGVLRRTASWSWDTHPYSGGAFAWFSPGQHTA